MTRSLWKWLAEWGMRQVAGRLGNVSAVAYLSECRHDVYSAGRGKSGERLIYAGDPKRGIAACCDYQKSQRGLGLAILIC